jgi:hypothetical protein
MTDQEWLQQSCVGNHLNEDVIEYFVERVGIMVNNGVTDQAAREMALDYLIKKFDL